MSKSSKTAIELLEDLISELEVATSGSLPEVPRNKEKSREDKKSKARPVKIEPKYPPKDVETLHALDLRVGVIKSVKKHESADKLYCEEIDIGEDGGPRAIASGLVPHYSLEEMQNKRLIVVANLKPKNLVGFRSFGMVLCASKVNKDGTEKVEFVDPPLEAPIGARVIAEGMELFDPLTGAQVDKQKIFEKVAGVLKTNEVTEAEYKGVKLVVEGKGVECAKLLLSKEVLSSDPLAWRQAAV